MISVLSLLVRLGLQSVAAHKSKSIIVGGLMAFGAFLVVTGTAMLGSVEQSMRSSIVNSVTGDIQVYDKDAPDPLALFGGFGMGSDDIGEVPSFRPVRDGLLQVPNVKAVVPLGIANVNVSTPGDLDRALNGLRDAVRTGDAEAMRVGAESVRRIATTLKEQRQKTAQVATADDELAATAVLERATSDAFWAELAADPLPSLDWLDTQLAPLGEQGQLVYFRLAGTDLGAFQKEFSKLKIVQGAMVPAGQRGLLLGQITFECELKMPIAKNLDLVSRGLKEGKTIATDQVLQETVAKNLRLHSRILYDLGTSDAKLVEDALRAALPGTAAPDLSALLVEFLTVTDANFAARYQLFYDVIAPRIQLYPFAIGDTITLSAFTKTGFMQSVNVKLYGTYAFEGLESSDLAGALALADIVTFRNLYGARTAELDAELLAMKKSVGAQAVAREDAEAALFGGDTETVAEAVETKTEVIETLSTSEERARGMTSTFSQDVVDDGLVLSAAVILHDPERINDTLKDLKAAGEPLGVQAVDWQSAAGIIGQFIWVIRGVLTIAILIIFAVAIVIINNSMVMATLERVAEIGTMRAIGAGKSFVTWMIIFETAVLGIIAGGLGALAGAGFILWLGRVGIPAGSDFLTFLFAGPRLFPDVSMGNIVTGLIATIVVSVAATLYPARLATGIQPVVAMQGKE